MRITQLSAVSTTALHLPTYLYFRVKNECSLPRLEKCVFFFFNSNLTCLYYVQYIHKHIIEAIQFLFSDLDGQSLYRSAKSISPA